MSRMGHIYTTTLKSGVRSYIARYQGTDGVRRTKSFRLRREATEFLKHTEAAVQHREWVAPELQQGTLYELLVASAEAAVRPNTRNLKQATANTLGPIRDIPMAALTAADLELWLRLCRTGRPWANGTKLSESSVRMYFSQIKAVLNQQVRSRHLVVSPAVSVRMPVATTRTVSTGSLMTTKELHRLVAAASATPAAMILVQASTGLRPGELCGLTVGSVQGFALSVTHQPGLQPLKTPTSVRSVPVPAQAHDALTNAVAGRTDPDTPLFTTRKHGWWSSTTYGEAFNTAVAAAGIRKFTPHALRHFYASLLIGSGVDVRTVQHRLGHATATETLDTYTHLWNDNPEVTNAAVDRALGLL